METVRTPCMKYKTVSSKLELRDLPYFVVQRGDAAEGSSATKDRWCACALPLFVVEMPLAASRGFLTGNRNINNCAYQVSKIW